MISSQPLLAAVKGPESPGTCPRIGPGKQSVVVCSNADYVCVCVCVRACACAVVCVERKRPGSAALPVDCSLPVTQRGPL